ncbi:hypothetical protein MGYG_00640 [Nannizzia gypsea CBS 118893]|uniref:Uncharacterized protein n=1 Tax=Arthroderma gypseum (strain ATCC MYA-4604 / CBS 118893) TaxID=535722 RepID=E5R0Z7_ARTGP|nr:hypothetical protein MGYG_00640 [Nannizzia gypsea CBS 118893]EFQ97601.1 hypothetical protein MGYG_00640 [Nannizzia gypsea CBS 118893]
MFTEIYLNHANETIKRMVAKNETHRISRKKIELQILEGIDNSEFPTTFRIIFYSMVLHTNKFDIYWFGQQFLHDLPNSSIAQLKPKMSLLHDLEGTNTIDTLTSTSNEESEASDAEQSEKDHPNDDSDITNVLTPSDDEAPSHIHPSSPSPLPLYPTPSTTPVKKTKSIIDHINETEGEDEYDYTAQAADLVMDDPLDDEDYLDPSFDDSVVTAFGVQISGPRRAPAISPVPKSGILKSKTSAKRKRGSGPKKEAPARSIGASKAKTARKKGTGAGTGAGVSKAKRGKGVGLKEKEKGKAKEANLA